MLVKYSFYVSSYIPILLFQLKNIAIMLLEVQMQAYHPHFFLQKNTISHEFSRMSVLINLLIWRLCTPYIYKHYLFLNILMFSLIDSQRCCGTLITKEDNDECWLGEDGALWSVSTRNIFMYRTEQINRITDTCETMV